ncbi:MAG: DUF2065 domain-containing protein [Pseudomonadota bacterium]
MWSELLAGLSLVLILEGILPFLSPSRFREAMKMAAQMDDTVLRVLGLVSMILGLIVLSVVK